MPGVDFLAPGLIIALQEEKPRVVVWLALIWVLLQEGVGSLVFGSVILSYSALVFIYFLGHWIFEAKSFLFMIFLGLCLGALHFLLLPIVGTLQELYIPTNRILLESLLQALFFPLELGLAYVIYNQLPIHESSV